MFSRSSVCLQMDATCKNAIESFRLVSMHPFVLQAVECSSSLDGPSEN